MPIVYALNIAAAEYHLNLRISDSHMLSAYKYITSHVSLLILILKQGMNKLDLISLIFINDVRSKTVTLLTKAV